MIYTREEENLITLDSFEELTYKSRYTLLSALTKAEPDFVKYRGGLIKNLDDGVYNKVESRYNNPNYRQKLLKAFEKRGIECVTFYSEKYPRLLKEIPCPPIVLYCKGNTELLKTRCFSIVGSRRTTANVIAETKKFSKELSGYFTVVTGMADGGDSAAVEGALESGKVISVLAYGFDYFYPAVNEGLIKKVAQNGLLITEYTPQIAPKPYQFPVRNRIIAGLSEGTLVVSAGKKSGTLITAGYATEYSRHVFAFPYGIGASSGEGCNNLIKHGAYLTDGTEDILGIFGLERREEQATALTGEELALYNALKEAGEGFLPDVADKLGKLPFELIPTIAALEIKGKAVRLGGNRYAAI